jgi:predicted nuclease with TOPRIM domain
MLTKEDLEQLRAVVRDEVRRETATINNNVQRLQAAVWSVKEDVKSLTGDMLVLKEDVQRVEQKVDRVEQMAKDDGEILGDISARLNDVLTDHDVRIERLEKHTGLSHS